MKLGIAGIASVVLVGCFDLDAVSECVRVCAESAGACARAAILCEAECEPGDDECELSCRLGGAACMEEGVQCVSLCGDEL